MDECLEFLRMVLPQRGLYCITTIARDAKYRANMPFADLESAVAFAQSSARVANVYFALSSFDFEGNKFKRTAAMAREQKAFWLDLDVDPVKAQDGAPAYADRTEAITEFGTFLKRTGLPLPSFVSSGNGFHVYWALTHEIPTTQWKQVAKLMRKLCVHEGLKIDHHRTCDVASVLRVPGTFNHKHEAKPVTVLSRQPAIAPADFAGKIIKALQQYGDFTPSAADSTSYNSALLAEGLSFGESFTTPPKDLPPRSPKQMIIKCRQIREMGSSPYGAWIYGIRTLLHTTATDELIHMLSKMNGRDYDVDECQDQIDRMRSDMSIGPCTCNAFESACADKCRDCAYKTKVKTPWSLAEVAVPKAVEIPKPNIINADFTQGVIPVVQSMETTTCEPYADETYKVIPNRGVFKTVLDEEGVPHTVQISDNVLYIHTLCIDCTKGTMPERTYIVRKEAPGCAPVDIPFVLSDALGDKKIELWTAQCGLLPHPKHKKDFYTFMNTYLASIQNKLPEVYVRNHFGWVTCIDRASGENYQGFIVGQKMYSNRGESQVRLDDRSASVAAKLGTRGNLEAWKQVPELYKTLDQKFAQLLMCTAFGAPLMRFGLGTATNVAFNLWEINGGKGKSALLKALASVWGDPQQMLMGRTDTHAARFQQYAVYRNLPILIDELTGISDEETASMLYDIVNGKEKARSTPTGTGLAQSGQWNTITVFTANQSMYEALRSYRAQSSATCMRLIEAVCDFKDYAGTAYAKNINAAMTAARDNYGLAGPKFIEFITKQPNLPQVVAAQAEKFANEHAETSDERFWMYGIAIPLIAGRIAKALGLLTYDLDALETYCVKELLPALRAKVKVNKPTGSNLLMDFLNDSLADTLIVRAKNRKVFKTQNEANGMAANNLSFGSFGNGTDPYVVQIPTRRLSVRRELDTETVYISSRELARWCKDRVISLDNMLQELQTHGYAAYGLNTKRFALGKDVPVLPTGTQTVYCFKVERGDINNAK